MNSKEFFSTLFIGVGIGLIAGVLTAPDSGSETLKKLSNAVKDKYKQLKGSAEDLVDNLESEGKNLIDKGSNSAKNYLKEGEEKLDGLKSQLNKSTF